MKWKISLFVAIILAMFALVPRAFAEQPVFSYTGSLYHVDEVTIPQGQVILGSYGQIKPKSDSIVAGFEYAFRYEVSDTSILSIDAKGNWKALKTGTVTVKVYGQNPNASPEFEAELDAHGIQRAENEPAVVYLPTPYTVEVFQPHRLPIYRLRHAKTGRYTYTPSTDQVARFQNWGWVNEGVAWTTAHHTGKPIYRAYFAGSNTYFFTANRQEYEKVLSNGWRGEGTAFLSAGQVPVYRFYQAGKYIYTKSEEERSTLLSKGYRYEGVAWYVE